MLPINPNSTKRKITKPPMLQKIHILCEKKTVMLKFFQIFSHEISQSQFSEAFKDSLLYLYSSIVVGDYINIVVGNYINI